MEARKMAGCCLILFGIINVLHKVHLNEFASDAVSAPYKIVTALLFAVGAGLLLRVNRRNPQT